MRILILFIISFLNISFIKNEVKHDILYDIELIEVVNTFRVFKAFACYESMWDSMAVNKSMLGKIPYDSLASGIVQQLPIMVREANRANGYEKYKLKDRFNPKMSFNMFCDIQIFKGNKDFDLKKSANIWYCGHIWKHNKDYYTNILKYYR